MPEIKFSTEDVRIVYTVNGIDTDGDFVTRDYVFMGEDEVKAEHLTHILDTWMGYGLTFHGMAVKEIYCGVNAD